MRGCANDELDDEALTADELRTYGRAAFQRLLEDLPMGTPVEAQHVAAILAGLDAA